ncbi:MAG TPA: alpha/beta hydrolase [Xanthobacteraceae bacterium]|jgi:acetyl esterase/lipase|nr:alpha/beta hydrolase [Xanthobacteraceae bacterium]
MTIAAAADTHAFTASRDRRVPARRIACTTSIPYAQGARHTLDVCRPGSAAAAPVVVFFYGGGWRSGNKALYRYVAKALARRGYVAVLPDYRVYPPARYPDFLDDGAQAVRWVKDNAQKFGGDPQKIFLMGHSAGAHIAAMLAVDPTWLHQVGLEPGGDIAGLIGVSGPYDFLPLKDEVLKIIFGGNRPQTQPITHVTPGAPPALLLTGGKDNVVGAGNSTRFAERLRAAGNEATAVVYPRIGHYLIIAALAPIIRALVPVLRDTEAFIAKVLKSRARTGKAAP